MNDKTKGCETCKYCARQDHGYSNWTVMNSTVWCLKGLNPEMPMNDEDIESAKFEAGLAFGETCTARGEGEGPYFDVEGEITKEDYKDDADLYALLLLAEEP